MLQFDGALGQQTRIDLALQAIENRRCIEFELFGKERVMDFSQFTPRGHYTRSVKLKKYFQCMMWLGRVDFRVAGSSELVARGEVSLRELATSVILLKTL